MTIKDITSENRSTTEEFYSLKKVITSYEAKINYYEEEINSLRLESQKTSHFSRGLEQQISSLNKELSKNRSELEMATSSKTRLSSQVDSLQRQLDIIQSENDKLHTLRDEDRGIISDLEEKCKELEENYRSLQEKLRVVQRESQGFCEVIREKGEELRGKEQIKKSLEKEIKELRAVTLKFEESLQENRKLRDLNENINHENKSLQNNIRDLSLAIKSKEEDFRCLKNSFDLSNKEIEALRTRLDDEQQRIFTLTSSLRQAEKTEENLRTTKNFLDDSEKREKKLQKELENLQMVLLKTEEKSNFNQKALESAHSTIHSLQAESSKLQKNLSDVNNRDNIKSIEITRYESRVQHLAAEIDDLKRKLAEVEHSKLHVAEELRDRQKALNAEQGQVTRISDQLLHLKDLLASSESSRNEYLRKIELFQSGDLEKEAIIKRLKEEVNTLKKILHQHERTINDAATEKDKLFKEIESCKYENSRKNDENLQGLNNLKRAASEIEDLRTRNKNLVESEENFKRSWRDSEIERSRIHEINLALNHQIEDLKKNCEKFQRQFQDLTKEFGINEGRLKNLEDRFNQVNFEKEGLFNKCEELTRDLRAKIEFSAGITREKEDLSIKIRCLSEEYDKLLRAYDYLNLDFKKLSGKASASESLTENLKKQEDLYLRKIKELEDQLRNLFRTCEMSEFKRIEAEKTAEAFINDVKTSKNMNRELDNAREDLHRRLNSIENEKLFFETRARSAENEISNLKAQLDYEKKKTLEYESRSFSIKESMKRQELEDEKNRSLQMQNSDLVSELHKQIEMYKVEGLRVEMNYMKLLDELNLTKHKLNRAEARVADLELSLR
jgi:chromosome segregation ATPase